MEIFNCVVLGNFFLYGINLFIDIGSGCGIDFIVVFDSINGWVMLCCKCVKGY